MTIVKTAPLTVEAQQGVLHVNQNESQGKLGRLTVCHSGIRQGCTLPPALFNYIIDWILGVALQVGTNVQVSDLAYAGDIMLLSNNYREI